MSSTTSESATSCPSPTSSSADVQAGPAESKGGENTNDPPDSVDINLNNSMRVGIVSLAKAHVLPEPLEDLVRDGDSPQVLPSFGIDGTG